MKNNHSINIRLPKRLIDDLKKHCEDEGVTVSDEIRRSIRMILRRAKRQTEE